MRALLDSLTRRRGTVQWDALLRGTALLGMLALYPALRWPAVAELVGFFFVSALVNGPLAPLLPATYEPILMVEGRVHPPLVVALVGVAAILWVEFLNYHLYRLAVLHPKLDRARFSPLVRRTVALFEKSPFFAIWLCAWSPLPYWAVRILAPLTRYPMWRYLLATFLGRAPRLWFFAALGPVVPVSTQLLATGVIVMLAVAIGITIRRFLSRQRIDVCLTGPGELSGDANPAAGWAARSRSSAAPMARSSLEITCTP